jgi:hypothetical protein
VKEAFSRSRAQGTINRGTTDSERLRDLRRALAAFMSRTFATSTEGGRPLYTPAALALANALKLTLAPEIGLELREDAQHVKECLAGRVAGVDRLLCSFKARVMATNRS